MHDAARPARDYPDLAPMPMHAGMRHDCGVPARDAWRAGMTGSCRTRRATRRMLEHSRGARRRSV
jgi:hypothetical protein